MKNNIYPVSQVKELYKYTEIDTSKYTSFVIAKVKVKTTSYIPVLPYADIKKKNDGTYHRNKIIWPTGTFYGMFSYQELQYAFEQNQIEDLTVYKQYVFRSEFIFDQFIDDLYNQRINADNDMFKLVLKLQMNSCYGKFCEREEKEMLIINPTKDEVNKKDKDDNFITRMYQSDLNIWTQKIVRDRPHIIVSIGSFITANSRLVLVKHIHKILAMGFDVWYCDTDSIYTDCPPEKMDVGPNLGQWKLEHDIYQAEFVLPKLYWFIDQCGLDEIRSKGIRLANKSEFDRYVLGELIEQKDIVQISPLKKSLKATGRVIDYIPVAKRNKNPSPKRNINNPLYLNEGKKPEWLTKAIRQQNNILT